MMSTRVGRVSLVVLGLLGFGQLAAAQVVYEADDGAGSVNTGPSFNETDFLWGNYFTAEPGGTLIAQVQVAYGRIAEGRAVDVLVYEDPDDDGNPLNGILIGRGSGITASPNANNPGPLDAFVGYNVERIDEDEEFDLPEISGGFFVAAFISGVDGLGTDADAPARRDLDSATDQGWVFFGPEAESDLTNLSAFPVAVPIGDPAVFGGLAGNNLVRAVAVPEPAVATALTAGLVALRRVRSRRSASKIS